jgi:ATP-dependent helicase/nuclease subunit A
MLTVYKASAGSGKTFQLVASYLKLLLKNPYNYRQILAVTFTNKATAEMKSRILQQLHLLASGGKSAYAGLLAADLSMPEKTIRSRAGQVLKNILHDYSRFSVSTIDSFTQRVIRAFNREMGISPHFVLELNDDLVLEEAVDRLLAKVDTDKMLRKWLVEFSSEKIKENRSQQIESDIKLLGKELFREKFQLFFPDGNDSVYTRDSLEKFGKELWAITSGFKKTMSLKASECMRLIYDNGFSVDDFLYKGTGVAGYLKNVSESGIKEPGPRVRDAAQLVDKWVQGKHPQLQSLGNLVEHHLQPLLVDLLNYYEDNLVLYNSASEVMKQLRMLGILTDLKQEIKLLMHEKGMLQISDSNLLLSKIIAGSDSPFIYEKTGSRFSYYMLDEFQDTSGLQWNNFKPLVSDALSEGHEALLVGDVKQSIYRWRNSDWNILASQIATDFPPFPPREVSLDKNWRSRRNIIRFNNASVAALKQVFLQELPEPDELEYFSERLESIYSQFAQEPGNPEAPDEGLAEISFLPEVDFEESSAALLVEQVKRLQDQGLKASDIAILIRKNSEGAIIVKTFMDASAREENTSYNLSVISNESLFLFASQGVNFVMLVIEWLKDSENKVWKAALMQLWFSWLKLLVQPEGDTDHLETEPEWLVSENFDVLFEQELKGPLEQIRNKTLLLSLDETIMEICSRFGLYKVGSELPFLQTLTDKAAELRSSLSNDLSGFLLWWNESGYKTSVSVNEEVDAVRLMTVHKAKGLEFEALLLPFFNWDTCWVGNLAPVLWCRPSTEAFSRFPLLPVKAGKNLNHTIFRNDYIKEKINYHIDTLNLVYVAITRAKSVLFVNCKKREDKNGNSAGKTVNVLLEKAILHIEKENSLAGNWDQEGKVYSFGVMPVFKSSASVREAAWIRDYAYSGFGSRIGLRLNSDDFLMAGEERPAKNTGKLVHEILACINDASGIEKACKKAFDEGRINAVEKEIIVAKLKSSMQHPEIGRWFSGNYKVLNERSLLSREKILRPDRIMISGSDAIVVDYKWGERKQDKYQTQVRRYAAFLRMSGFKKVEGFIWYINLGEVEEVKSIEVSGVAQAVTRKPSQE